MSEPVTPEEYLSTAEAIVNGSELAAMLAADGANVEAFIAMSATIGLILQDIEQSDCVCDVCDTLRQLEKTVKRGNLD